MIRHYIVPLLLSVAICCSVGESIAQRKLLIADPELSRLHEEYKNAQDELATSVRSTCKWNTELQKKVERAQKALRVYREKTYPEQIKKNKSFSDKQYREIASGPKTYDRWIKERVGDPCGLMQSKARDGRHQEDQITLVVTSHIGTKYESFASDALLFSKLRLPTSYSYKEKRRLFGDIAVDFKRHAVGFPDQVQKDEFETSEQYNAKVREANDASGKRVDEWRQVNTSEITYSDLPMVLNSSYNADAQSFSAFLTFSSIYDSTMYGVNGAHMMVSTSLPNVIASTDHVVMNGGFYNYWEGRIQYSIKLAPDAARKLKDDTNAKLSVGFIPRVGSDDGGRPIINFEITSLMVFLSKNFGPNNDRLVFKIP